MFKSSAIDDEIELHIQWININYVEILILVPRDERYGITSWRTLWTYLLWQDVKLFIKSFFDHNQSRWIIIVEETGCLSIINIGNFKYIVKIKGWWYVNTFRWKIRVFCTVCKWYEQDIVLTSVWIHIHVFCTVCKWYEHDIVLTSMWTPMDRKYMCSVLCVNNVNKTAYELVRIVCKPESVGCYNNKHICKFCLLLFCILL